MTRESLLVAGAAISFAMMMASLLLARLIMREDRLTQRVAGLWADADAGAPPMPPTSSSLRQLAAIGELLSRLLPAATLAELQRSVAEAGARQPVALGLFIGAKLLLTVLLGAIALVLVRHTTFPPSARLLAIGGGAVLGLLLPDAALRRRIRRRRKLLERGLPDALDMLVICIEAGLGLEAALERVANEIATTHAAVTEELRLTLAEMRFMADRRAALLSMGQRTGLETLKRLAGTLIQSMQYGTPLNQALRGLSTELRAEMLVRFEAQATRLPVLLTVPMILFILPCVFIVVGGPAALTLIRNFSHP